MRRKRTEIDKDELPLPEEPEEEEAQEQYSAQAVMPEPELDSEGVPPARRRAPLLPALGGVVALLCVGWIVAYFIPVSLEREARAPMKKTLQGLPPELKPSGWLEAKALKRRELERAIDLSLGKPFYVPLRRGGGGEEVFFLKLALTLELSDSATAQEAKSKLPLLRKKVFTLLRSTTFESLRGRGAGAQLKGALMASLNGALTTGQLKRLYFTDFIIH